MQAVFHLDCVSALLMCFDFLLTTDQPFLDEICLAERRNILSYDWKPFKNGKNYVRISRTASSKKKSRCLNMELVWRYFIYIRIFLIYI